MPETEPNRGENQNMRAIAIESLSLTHGKTEIHLEKGRERVSEKSRIARHIHRAPVHCILNVIVPKIMVRTSC